MTSTHNLGERVTASDRRLSLSLLAAFLVAASGLSVALLRRPFHDTAGELLVWRVWVSDVLHAGDLPFWMPHARFGFPLTTLHLAPAVWSPVGLLLGAVFHYDVWTLAIENVLWRLLGLAGAYSFARPHLRSPLSAAAVAVGYVGSGFVALITGGGSIGGSMFAGMMVGPWIAVALHRISIADSPATWRRGTGLLALSVAGQVLNGYPGTWLTAPLLLAPYGAVLALRSRRALMGSVSAVLIAAILAAVMASLFLAETRLNPLFGPAGRDPIVTQAGTFELTNLPGLWLSNSVYLRYLYDGGSQLIYLGLPVVLLVSASWPAQLARPRRVIRPIALLIAGGIAVRIAAAQASDSHVFHAAPFALILCALFCLPGTYLRWRRIDVALCASIAFVFLTSSDNPIGDVLRRAVPPFSILRWNYYYLWLAALMLPLLAWRVGEALIKRLILPDVGRLAWAIGHGAPLLAPIAGAFTLTLAASGFTGWDRADVGSDTIEVVNAGWTIALCGCVAAAAVAWWRTGCTRGDRWVSGGALFALSAVLIGGGVWGANEAVVRAAIQLPTGGRIAFDALHLLAVGVALLVAVWRSPSAGALLRSCAAIAILDVSLAGARYMTSRDSYVSSQSSAIAESTRAFTFVQGERMPSQIEGMYPRFRALLDKTITMSVWPNYLPHVAAWDRSAGDASPFQRLTQFPRVWRVTGSRSVDVGAGQLLADPAPMCGGAPPEARVVRLLASVVELDISVDCERLLVYNDSWAPGWRVWVDGQEAEPLAVDGAVRGVMLLGGRHHVRWMYRPPGLGPLLMVTSAGVAVTAALLLGDRLQRAGARRRIEKAQAYDASAILGAGEQDDAGAGV